MGSSNISNSTRSKAIRIEVQGSGAGGGGPRKSRNGGNNKDDRVRWFNMLEQELAGTRDIFPDKSRYNRTLIRILTLTRAETRINIRLRGTCTRPYRVVRRESITVRLREIRWSIIRESIIPYRRNTIITSTDISIANDLQEVVLSMGIPVITISTAISRTTIARAILTLMLRVAAVIQG